MYNYKYPRPSVTADICLFSPDRTQLLLIRRAHEPFAGCWAFPGGFFDLDDDDIAHTAQRELLEETGLSNIPLEELCTASRKDRDPRGRTISVVFGGMADPNQAQPFGGGDASEARWWPLSALPNLAFDHEEILAKVCNKMNVPAFSFSRI